MPRPDIDFGCNVIVSILFSQKNGLLRTCRDTGPSTGRVRPKLAVRNSSSKKVKARMTSRGNDGRNA